MGSDYGLKERLVSRHKRAQSVQPVEQTATDGQQENTAQENAVVEEQTTVCKQRAFDMLYGVLVPNGASAIDKLKFLRQGLLLQDEYMDKLYLARRRDLFGKAGKERDDIAAGIELYEAVGSYEEFATIVRGWTLDTVSLIKANPGIEKAIGPITLDLSTGKVEGCNPRNIAIASILGLKVGKIRQIDSGSGAGSIGKANSRGKFDRRYVQANGIASEWWSNWTACATNLGVSKPIGEDGKEKAQNMGPYLLSQLPGGHWEYRLESGQTGTIDGASVDSDTGMPIDKSTGKIAA